ncbi:DUF6680 family protein [Sphingomonas sp. LB3N6]|uniref:DUF6680 family protein n=1 Tax=Sphingomonas fucosidasi TaxID=3096164 RepID=UPI002FC638C2
MTSWSDPAESAAFLSAVAAIAAAVAAWRGPLTAAKMSDALRVNSDKSANSRQIRLNVFATIMQGRAEIYSEDTVRALNFIDVAFSDDTKVRECWSELFQALSPVAPDHVIDERLRRLLKAMSLNLGLSDSLRQDDFGRVYFPTALLEERNVRQLERKAALARLTGNISPAANSAEVSTELQKWPPKPL